MALDVQNQHPQPLQRVNVSGGSISFVAGLDHAAATAWSLTSLRRAIPSTLDLFQPHPSSFASSTINLEEPSPLPFDIEYTIQRVVANTKMSKRNGSGPKLDLKLNLSPPRANPQGGSPSRSATVSRTSPPSSCVSSELNQDETLRHSNRPEATSMVLVGCPRCLLYVMLSKEDPRCPKCKSTVLLDVFHENTTTTTTTTSTTISRKS